MNNITTHPTLHHITNKHIYIFDKWAHKPFEIEIREKYNYFWGIKVNKDLFKKAKIGDLLVLEQKHTAYYLKIFEKIKNQKYNWLFIEPDMDQRSHYEKENTKPKNTVYMTAKEKIENWLNGMGIENYIINTDLTVDVNECVYLSNKDLTEIPIKFGSIKGNVYCNDNNLTSLDFAPKKCEWFDCHHNPKLTKEYLSNFDFSFIIGQLFTDYEDIDNTWNKR